MSKHKDLLIVESPTKARTITRLLGEKMTVLSSKGHIIDLPKSKLGVDIENNFEPSYIKIRGKEGVIKELQAAAKKAGTVFIGSDPDREGEAIAYFIAQAITGASTRRVRFHEITSGGMKKAFAETSDIDQHMVDSQKARRVLDRLVGYLASPLLWRVFARGSLSAGRVQSVALRLICEREKEILAFKPEEFWIIDCDLKNAAGDKFVARLVKCEGEDCRIGSEAEARKVQSDLEQGAKFLVSKLKISERRRSPNPPFITSTLQQDAARNMHYTGRRTMRIAQQLFEGINLGTETAGLITYPRTDAVRVAAEMIGAVRDEIAQRFGKEYLPDQARYFKEKKGAQGAHEAIRPTSLARTPDAVKAHLSPEQFKLYDLIYRRFLASQMADARYLTTVALIDAGQAGANACSYILQANALKQVFPGYEKVYGAPDKEKSLPPLAEGETVFLDKVNPEQHFTQPPPRYSEAALIKKLEVNGIGRPSTYATIVSTLDDREYVRRKEGRLFPTELGMKVNDVLIPRFDNVFEIGFTREMETELDLVEEGKEKWQDVVRRFYEPFHEDLAQAEKELEEKCPKCGKPLALKRGRYGAFLACSGYPECDYVKKEAKEEKIMEEKCPQCGKPLVERTGKFGKFVGCSGYPECKYIKKDAFTRTPVEAAAGAPAPEGTEPTTCPECGKPLVEKEGRFGKFLGCSGYPDCKYIHKPEPKLAADAKCPVCGKPLTMKEGRYGKFIGCSGYPECKYIQSDRKKAAAKTLDEKCPECGRPLVEREGRYGKFVSCSGYPQCKYRPPKKSKE